MLVMFVRPNPYHNLVTPINEFDRASKPSPVWQTRFFVVVPAALLARSAHLRLRRADASRLAQKRHVYFCAIPCQFDLRKLGVVAPYFSSLWGDIPENPTIGQLLTQYSSGPTSH